MKNLLWFLLGITGGVVAAHFVNRDPRGHQVLAQVDARISEFTDRIGSAYREQEARFAGPLSEVKEAAATAVSTARDAAASVVEAAKDVATSTAAAATDTVDAATQDATDTSDAPADDASARPTAAPASDIPTPAEVAAAHPAPEGAPTATPRTSD